MAVRSVEIEIGGEKYSLRRSWKSAIQLRKRFGTENVQAILEPEDGRLEALTGVLYCFLRTPDGKPLTITEDQLSDSIDMLDTADVITTIVSAMSDGKPADPRSLAPFVPTPIPLVCRMLEVADLAAGEVLVDPCCGIGGVLTAACARGARAVGYEIDPGRAKQSRDAIAGMPAEVHESDGAAADFSVADVVFLYTLPASNEKLQPLLLAQCKDNCRIVSHAFDMPGWVKAHQETFDGKRFYMWRMGEVREWLKAREAGEVDADVYRSATVDFATPAA